MRLSLLYHILPFKLKITFISCPTTEFHSVGPVPTWRVFWSSCRFLVNRSDTNCWDLLAHVQLYIIWLVWIVSFPKYLVLWVLEVDPHVFTFSFLPKRPRTILDNSLYIRLYLSNSPMWDLVCYITSFVLAVTFTEDLWHSRTEILKVSCYLHGQCIVQPMDNGDQSVGHSCYIWSSVMHVVDGRANKSHRTWLW